MKSSAFSLLAALLLASCWFPVTPPEPTPAPAPAPVEVAQVSLDKASVTLPVGASLSLVATLAPSNATNPTVTWSSTNASVVTASGGTLSTLSVGTAVVTATASSGVSASCAVTVLPSWSWTGGSTAYDQASVYGSKGTPAASNQPGARWGAATWVDTSGNHWLFGGAASGNTTQLGNDLWKQSGGVWTWVAGSSSANQAGVYPTLGTSSATATPGARYGAAAWTDASGHLWLFGGSGLANLATAYALGDLWMFDGSQWTWVAGSSSVVPAGVYGTMGTASASNLPGGRVSPVFWKDVQGNFYLFGGMGEDALGHQGYLNDLWKFDGASWTWLSGSDTASQNGSTGANAAPGGRMSALGWTDGKGSVWVYGGYGLELTGLATDLGDFWKFDGTTWTRLGQSSARVSGTLKVASATNTPGPRELAATWVDAQGGLWLWGGTATDAQGNFGYGNDLWRYDGAQWTWLGGSSGLNAVSTYGTLGDRGYEGPGARDGVAVWASGNGVDLLGGEVMDTATSARHRVNDAWHFQYQ